MFSCNRERQSGEPENDFATQADSLYQAGKLASKSGNKTQAIKLLKSAVRDYKKADLLHKLPICYNNVGLYFYQLGLYDSAKLYYGKAVSLDSVENERRLIIWYKNIGITDAKRGHFHAAISSYKKALTLAQKYENPKEKASINFSIGNVLNRQKQYKEALIYHTKARDIWLANGETKRYAKALNSLGNDYLGVDDFVTAIIQYKTAISTWEGLKTSYNLQDIYNNLGRAYLDMDKLDSANFYLQISKKLKEDSKNFSSMAVTFNNLAELNLERGDLKEVYFYLDYDTAWLINQEYKLDNLNLRRKYYERKGETDSALQYTKQWANLNQEIFQQGTLKTLTEVSNIEKSELQYQKRISDQQLALEKKEKMFLVFFVSFSLLVLLIIAYFLLKVRKLNGELDKVNRDMFHRKRNDYTRIIDTLEEDENFDAGEITNMLLASTALDESLYINTSGEVHLPSYFIELTGDLKDALALEANNIKLNCKADTFAIKKSVAVLIARVYCELVTNSCKHSFKDSPGIIYFTLSNVGQGLEVTYIDNGIAFQDTSREGGMGSQLIHNYMEELGCTIKRQRVDNKNVTTFTILVKKPKYALNEG